MESHSTYFGGILLECFGDYDQPDETTGYKGGWVTAKVEHKGEDITCLISETNLEQIDEQIANEY